MNPVGLPCVAALLPIITVNVCYLISASAGHIPGCFPYVEGCTTISSAGRHGISYILFKTGMIPTAVVLTLFWPMCRRWFLSLGGADSFGLRAMVWIGVVSGLFLVMYTAALGSEGDFYKLLRRFGVTVHFSFGYLAQVLLLNRLWDERVAGRLMLSGYISSAMFAITVALFLLGLVSIPVGELIPDPDDTIIDTIEWNFALLLFGWYLLPWLGWRESGFGG